MFAPIALAFGHGNSTSYPVRPATHPALRAGWVTGLAGSQYRDGLNRRNTSAFYRSVQVGFSGIILRANIPAFRGKPAHDFPCPILRDSYISNATHTGKSSHATFKQWFRRLKPRQFRNLSVFSIELAATSLTH